MATTSKKIWQIYVFSHLDDDNNIVYFAPTNNALVYYTKKRGKTYKVTIYYPTETDMNDAGWYRTVNVAEDGTDVVIDNVLYHYTGTPDSEGIEEPIEDGE